MSTQPDSPTRQRIPDGAPETRLQLALDQTAPAEAERVVTRLGAALRRVEIGTPLVLAAGVETISRVRACTPAPLTVVADVKICDAGEKIARNAFAAGADVITAVAAAIDEPTWRGTLTAAAEHVSTHGSPDGAAPIVLDTIGPRIDPRRLARFAETATEIGVRVELCVHRPKLAAPGFADLIAPIAAHVPGFAGLAVAGKLGAAEVVPALTAGFGTLIVGGAVGDAADPEAAWQQLCAEVARWQRIPA
jgi:3-keto-L-gulonate-6-phosphate decarboxylase